MTPNQETESLLFASPALVETKDRLDLFSPAHSLYRDLVSWLERRQQMLQVQRAVHGLTRKGHDDIAGPEARAFGDPTRCDSPKERSVGRLAASFGSHIGGIGHCGPKTGSASLGDQPVQALAVKTYDRMSPDDRDRNSLLTRHANHFGGCGSVPRDIQLPIGDRLT